MASACHWLKKSQRLANRADNTDDDDNNDKCHTDSDADWSGESFVLYPPLMNRVAFDSTDFGNGRVCRCAAALVLFGTFFLATHVYL